MAVASVSASTCVDPILKELEEEWWTSDLPYWAPEVYEQVEFLKIELRFLKTFLRYIADWNDEDNDLRFGSLVVDIEAAIKAAEVGLSFAAEVEYERRAVFVEPSISELQEKLELFSPSIKEAYNDLTNNPFYSESSTINICLWREFPEYLQQNLLDLCNGKVNLSVVVKEQLRALTENLKSFTSFVNDMVCLDYFQEHPLSMYLFTHFGSLVVHVAHLSYLCCVDELDEYAAQEMVIMLVNVQKEFKPSRKEVMEIHLNFIASSKSDMSVVTDKLVHDFINFLVAGKNQFETLFKGLKFLLKFFIDAPNFYEEDVNPVLMDIVSVFTNAGSLSYLFHLDEMTGDMARESHLELSLLLEKVELLKAEILIMELLNQKGGSVVLLKDQIDSLNEGLNFLRSFLTVPAKGRTQIANPISVDIETVANEAAFVYHSFQAKEVSENRVADGLLKLLIKIRIFKAEALLRKILSSNPNLMVPLRKQIERFYAELIFFRTFLMSCLDEKGKLISPRVESMAGEVETFYYSFHANEIAEELVMKLSLLVPNVVEKMMEIKAEVRDIYLQIRSSSRSNFPKTNKWGFLDFLLENLKEILNREVDAIAFLKHHLEFIHHEMVIFQSFLRDTARHISHHSELKNLHLRIIDVAYETEFVIDSFMVGGGIFWYHWLWLPDLIEEIKIIKIQASEISEKTFDGIPSVPETSSDTRPYATRMAAKSNEVVVSFNDQEELIMERLTRGSLHREIVSIVGMGGVGKTTLAKKVYSNPSVTHHFHILAWCWVSQEYRKRELLLAILSAIVENTENILEMCDEDLELKLYQSLKGKRYFVVMDDMWKSEAWEDMRPSFPDDENGSRILITSRLHDVALKVKLDIKPHFIRPLSDDQSWKLLEMKLFHEEGCPEELLEVGKKIAKNCKGLPLAVIAIVGLLERTNKNQDWWKQIAENLSSRIVDDPETRCKDILELSYNHLPNFLKPCFLYIGVFLKDKEIQVQKLITLWISEGFIQGGEAKSLEDAAEEYLMDLIHRSLLTIARRSSNGKVKACHMHDMLRDLCLARCREENFLQLIDGYDNLFASSHDGLDYGVDPDYSYPLNAIKYEGYRLSILSRRNHFIMANPSGPHVRSLLFTASRDAYPRCPYDISFVSYNFGLLRVLDLECINMGNSFPNAIASMVHLRYLALSGDIDSVPSSVAKLWNLETFILRGLKGKVVLPDSIWSMGRLRHIHVNNIAVFSLQDDNLDNSNLLHNLVSLSSPSLSFGYKTEKILRRLPNLRKLRCIFLESRDTGNSHRFPVLGFLEKLESLKILFYGGKCSPLKFDFPLNLRKLTLSNFRLQWDYASEIGRLPNLEVLKLLSRAFEGKTWKMRNGEFKKLKFLKLDSLNISQWDASSDHLPMLQRLVLRNCKQLEEIPSDFGEISTLQMIEVLLCGHSVEKSVRKLEEDQLDLGNEELKILINLKDWESDHPYSF